MMAKRLAGEGSSTSAPHTHLPHVNGDDMLTISEACELLRVPEGTLRYWRHQGSGPHSFKIGRHVRYWRADLLVWLEEQTNHSQVSP
ncbi:helix-turn-helix domain-containing protein [Nocardioides sp.]|uniref:helix-turn-helix domain-containing protein n=1 Tax=Nocardioides sp. TaxID=35761 RepID=UPI002D19A86A|nr:helix-turn-helix domain-containing protein [Nocardioides sp.]HSX68705.1 helix-turn-helix domain-containing protein [Nocardioides sp.]